MDIELHYYINYILAQGAGISSDVAYKIAYSAQYVDDNTEHYVVLERKNFTQYNNIITQSLNLNLNTKDIIGLYPIFHFIPGDEIFKTSSLRRDGAYRYMTTTPDSKLARLALKRALVSNDPYYIGIASHAYADTWAHQNFTGLKDVYNCVNFQQTNQVTKALAVACIGHSNVLSVPDSANITWYDFRLKDMKIDNQLRLLEASHALFKMYIKYADASIAPNKPKNPARVWKELSQKIQAILKNDFEFLKSIFGSKCGLKSNKSFLMAKILGMNSDHRIELYKTLANQHSEYELEKYNKNKWIQTAMCEVCDSIKVYDSSIVNDNLNIPKQADFALCDGGNAQYGIDMPDIKNKVFKMLGLNKNIHVWRNDHYKTYDWYNFQEAAKKHYDYMLDKVLKIMRKDIAIMQKANS